MRHILEVSAELLPITCGDLTIAQSVYPIWFLDQIVAQERAPGLVIDYDPRAWVVG
jgi:hypothetical protein